jgi:peptidoglycan/LPS O-acetylase OafA/YrhL
MPEIRQSVHGPLTEPSLLSSLFLFPDNAPPALSVAWTLVFEMVFYTLFLVYFVSTRVFVLAMIAWGVGILAWTGSQNALLDTLFSHRNVEFLLGMGIACLVRVRWGNTAGWTALLVGTIALIALVFTPPPYPPKLVGPCFAVILFALVILERNGRIRVPDPLVWLGDASYSLYLTHNPVQSAISRVVPKLLPGSTWWLGMGVAIVGCLAVTMAYHRYFEVPAIKALRRLARRTRKPASEPRIPLREVP